VLLLSLAVVSVLWIHRRAGATAIFFGIYGSCAVSYLVAKLALAAAYRPARTPTPNLAVAAVVPAYNEDPAVIAACIRSLLDQTHPFAEIWVVDDGSEHRGAYHAARDLLAGLPGCQVIRMRHNAGKRKAQALPFHHARAEIIMTIDSDTVLHPAVSRRR
jgi:cellulose synthase/poly-beta-1,6-N-acetylglucosamine synthase-like glycosyltransferase